MIAMSAASRFISELLATPDHTVDHWIAEDIWNLGSSRPAVLAYLGGLMSMHPESDRAHEVAWEIRSLIGGAS